MGRPRPKVNSPSPMSATAAESRVPVKATPAKKATRKRSTAKPKTGLATAPTAAVAQVEQVPAQLTIDEQTRKWVEENYGDYMAHFLNDQEIGPIILASARAGEDANRLMGRLSKTKWWQNTSDAARKWEALKAEDPASATAQIQQAFASISDKAKTMGLGLNDAALMKIAEDSLKFGWSPDQLVDSMMNSVSPGGIGPGSIAVTKAQIMAMAKKYMMPLSDTTAMGWALSVAKGEMDISAVQAILTEQAKSRWPQMADLIDAGGTPDDWFAPYRESASRLLEVPPLSIDFTDPKWSTAVQDPNDPTQVMRLTDFETNIRMDPRYGYQYTKGANEMVDSLTLFLGDRFGRATS